MGNAIFLHIRLKGRVSKSSLPLNTMRCSLTTSLCELTGLSKAVASLALVVIRVYSSTLSGLANSSVAQTRGKWQLERARLSKSAGGCVNPKGTKGRRGNQKFGRCENGKTKKSEHGSGSSERPPPCESRGLSQQHSAAVEELDIHVDIYMRSAKQPSPERHFGTLEVRVYQNRPVLSHVVTLGMAVGIADVPVALLLDTSFICHLTLGGLHSMPTSPWLAGGDIWWAGDNWVGMFAAN